jgi:23S rRNA (cytidine2498-2'-O)-methyltransferase
LQFLEKRLPKKIGVWGLLDQNKLFLSTYTDCPILGGAIQFVEDKNIPPSRAYLKLWELMTVYGFKPKSSETVLDMGSCPGGWSWVLSNVAKTVVSVDKAPLDDAIAKIPNIKFLKKDAFKLEPSEVGPVHWFFSDIICEPMRSYELVEKWMPFVDNFVCTVKFKGKADSQAVKKFQQLQPNLLKHLYNNKHEITFVKIKNS